MEGSDVISILLVEDDPIDTRLLLQLLDHADVCAYEVQAVASAEEAEAALAERSPDVVLLDLSLPDCDGLDSVDRILAAAPGTPVVVLTGRDDYALGLRSIEAGAQDFLVKGETKGNAILRCAQWAVARAHGRSGISTADRWGRVSESAMGMAIVDAALTIQLANPAFAELAGRPPDALSGTPLTDLVHDDVVDLVRDLRSTLRGETPMRRRSTHLVGAPEAAVALDIVHLAAAPTDDAQVLLLARAEELHPDDVR